MIYSNAQMRKLRSWENVNVWPNVMQLSDRLELTDLNFNSKAYVLSRRFLLGKDPQT